MCERCEELKKVLGISNIENIKSLANAAALDHLTDVEARDTSVRIVSKIGGDATLSMTAIAGTIGKMIAALIATFSMDHGDASINKNSREKLKEMLSTILQIAQISAKENPHPLSRGKPPMFQVKFSFEIVETK